MIWALEGEAPDIHPSAWIAPTAQVIGRVRIGPEASVWFGAVLRGDHEWIELGQGSNVQENSVLHTDWGFPLVVGRDCTVGHMATLHGCTLGDRVLVGMGATVLNGAAIADECLIGAAALVTEGKRFQPRSLIVGAPARAVRSLDDAAAERLLGSAQGYAANARRFRDGLTEVRRPA